LGITHVQGFNLCRDKLHVIFAGFAKIWP